MAQRVLADRYVPSFTLKKIDPLQVLEEYLSGAYASISIDASQKLNIKTAMMTSYSSEYSEKVYTFRDKNSITQIVATSNHANYQTFTATGGDLPDGGRCGWCRSDFHHKPVGIPVSVSTLTPRCPGPHTPLASHDPLAPHDPLASHDPLAPLGPDEPFAPGPDGADAPLPPPPRAETLVFFVDGTYCDFECALADLQHWNSFPSSHRDPLYANSEMLLHWLFRNLYPGKTLVPADDYRLLRVNGGPLEYDDFKDGSKRFYRVPNVIMAPVKVDYVRL